MVLAKENPGAYYIQYICKYGEVSVLCNWKVKM